MITRQSRLTAAAVILISLGFMSTAPLHAEVWGVKTHDPVSGPPSTLFRFDEDGGGFTTIGTVKVGGASVDVDGLAMDAGGALYGFRVEGAYSHLIAIHPFLATATAIGPTLDGRDIRGAIFAAGGRLLALDSALDELIEIDPATGLIVGSPVGLTLDNNPYFLPNFTDIAQAPDGSFLIGGAAGNDLYSLDITTGQLALVHTDTAVQPDNWVPTFAGLAFSRDAADPEMLFTYDVAHDDDIWTYQTDAAYARSALYLDIIAGYNAGRGDLATTPVPEPATLSVLVVAGLAMIRRRRRL